MTPRNRAILHALTALACLIHITRAVDAWIMHLDDRYWARKLL